MFDSVFCGFVLVTMCCSVWGLWVGVTGWVFGCFPVPSVFLNMFCVVCLNELSENVRDNMGKKRTEKYRSSNMLSKRRLGLNLLFADLVGGPECGRETHFDCKVCKRDVAMKAQCSGEFCGHYYSDGHWYREVTSRNHIGLPVYNRLMEPMTLSVQQLADFRFRPFVE